MYLHSLTVHSTLSYRKAIIRYHTRTVENLGNLNHGKLSTLQYAIVQETHSTRALANYSKTSRYCETRCICTWRMICIWTKTSSQNVMMAWLSSKSKDVSGFIPVLTYGYTGVISHAVCVSDHLLSQQTCRVSPAVTRKPQEPVANWAVHTVDQC
jgi:hypothetical protein